MARKTIAKKEHTSTLLNKFKTSATDTGSPEVQVALITDRINSLTDHLRTHKKDFSTQRGLMKLVGSRRRLLDYLKGTNSSRYTKLIGSLDLRK